MRQPCNRERERTRKKKRARRDELMHTDERGHHNLHSEQFIHICITRYSMETASGRALNEFHVHTLLRTRIHTHIH